MSDTLLRLGVAFVAGAVLRMFAVFGVPTLVTMTGLIAAGAAFSMGLQTSRLFVVLLISAGHTLAFWLTRETGSGTDTPTAVDLVVNGFALYLPWTLPPLGSALGLQYEKYKAKQKADAEVLTEEALLAEKVPTVPPPVDYDDLRDFDDILDDRPQRAN